MSRNENEQLTGIWQFSATFRRRGGFGWARIEGQSEVEIGAGDAWIQPPRIRHNVLAYSDDYEVLEITLSAEYETVKVEG